MARDPGSRHRSGGWRGHGTVGTNNLNVYAFNVTDPRTQPGYIINEFSRTNPNNSLAFDQPGSQELIPDVANAGQSGNAALFDSYNVPGGASGSLISAPMSLVGYTAGDKPTLYFNYYLDTEGDDSTSDMRDSFRVYASTDGANWTELATNNSVIPAANKPFTAELPPTPSRFGRPLRNRPRRFERVEPRPAAVGGTGASNQQVQQLYDKTDPDSSTPTNSATYTWRQARVDLGDFAGDANVQIRFDFSTAGSMNIGLQAPNTFANGDNGGADEFWIGTDRASTTPASSRSAPPDRRSRSVRRSRPVSMRMDRPSTRQTRRRLPTARASFCKPPPAALPRSTTTTLSRWSTARNTLTYQFVKSGGVAERRLHPDHSINNNMSADAVATQIFNALTKQPPCSGVTPHISGSPLVQLVGGHGTSRCRPHLLQINFCLRGPLRSRPDCRPTFRTRST